jgi:hypothetical protein
MRSMVEGPFSDTKNPSTALRAVPLPKKSWGGIQTVRIFRNNFPTPPPKGYPLPVSGGESSKRNGGRPSPGAEVFPFHGEPKQ